MFKRIGTLILGSSFAFSMHAQNCNAKFEVNAGPDIDVCENGSVGLNGIIGGDATEAIWRGGKGTFSPDRKALNAEYTPSAQEIGNGVVLILVASNPKMKDCTPERSEIKITVNSQPKVNAGDNVRACEGKQVTLHGTVTGKAKKLLWVSRGTGSFENENSADAVYHPSEKDISAGGCSIDFVAIPFGVCLPDTSTMILMIDKGPEFVTDNVKTDEGKPIKLSINSKDTPGKIEWKSDGTGSFSNTNTAAVTYTPSASDISKDKINVQVEVTDKTGVCSLKKNILLQLKKPN
jgi:hypothetical protein